MKLYVARHGETTWNVENRLMGTLPGELSDKGLDQAKQLGLAVQSLSIQLGFVSDLHRTIQTANEVAKLNPGLIFTPTDALRERHLGDLEGQLRTETNWKAIWAQPDDATPFNCESLVAFTDRVARFMVELDKYRDNNVLLITHEGTMNRLHFFIDPDNFEPQKYPNAEIVEFNYSLLIKGAKHFLNKTLS